MHNAHVSQHLALIFHLAAGGFAFLCRFDTVGDLLDLESCQRRAEAVVEVKAIIIVDVSALWFLGEDLKFATSQRLQNTLQLRQCQSSAGLHILSSRYKHGAVTRQVVVLT